MLIRIHIRADSNSAADQGVKLKVRDAVTAYLEAELDVDDYASAYAGIEKRLDAVKALADGGNEDVVLTGVGYRPGMTGVLVREHGETAYYEHRRIEPGCHGTGDVYASALTGGILRGMSTFEAAKLAADYTVESIKKTRDDPSHWYGVKFEKAMPYLIQQLQFRAR